MTTSDKTKSVLFDINYYCHHCHCHHS